MRCANPVQDFRPSSHPEGDVTQWFGENKPLYSKLCPSPGNCMVGGHNGIDIVRPHGSIIFCVEGGTVVEALGKETGYGTHVKVLSDSGHEWTYGHLSAIDQSCVWGERIERGQRIGKMGNTGFVVSGQTPFWKTNPYAGTHLHLGKRKIKPWNGTGQWSVTYFSGTAKEYRGIVENYDNGTFGALPLFPQDFEGYALLSPDRVVKESVKELTDTIAIVVKESEKATDSSVKSAFHTLLKNLLGKLSSMVK